MFYRTIGFLAAILLVAASATANEWTNCQGGTRGNLSQVVKRQVLCFDYDDTGTDSRLFFVNAVSALICFDPDKATEGVEAATINIRMCPHGQKPSSNPENECFLMNSSPITGVTGSAATQDACLRVASGAYYIDLVDAAGAGDDARVTIKAEGK